jgi:hypothetical protein
MSVSLFGSGVADPVSFRTDMAFTSYGHDDDDLSMAPNNDGAHPDSPLSPRRRGRAVVATATQQHNWSGTDRLQAIAILLTLTAPRDSPDQGCRHFR